VQALASFLVRRKVTPNGISIAGMIFATLGAGCYLALSPNFELSFCGRTVAVRLYGQGPGWYLSCIFGAAACIQLRLLCNLLDGLVAVEGGRKGKAGELFNEAPDRYADVILLAASGYAAGFSWLGWMAAAFAVATAYARAFGASVGLGQDFCGPFAKPQRMFFLTVGTLAVPFVRLLPSAGTLMWTLVLIAVGTLATFVRRIVRIYRRLP
jgi:phosphatidylglycerophosphate synthase